MIIFRKHHEPVGYYPIVEVQGYPDETLYDFTGEAFCEDCARVHSDGKCGEKCCDYWSVERAEPIYYWYESDYPNNCVACEKPIEHRLTAQGEHYVMDEHEMSPSDVTRAWIKTYGVEL